MGLGGGNIQVKGRGEQMFFLMINWRGGDKSNPWTKSLGPLDLGLVQLGPLV